MDVGAIAGNRFLSYATKKNGNRILVPSFCLRKPPESYFFVICVTK